MSAAPACSMFAPPASQHYIYVLIGSSTGSEQSKEVIFPESPSPSFLTVPGEGFAEPFELTPGKWIVHIRAQGVLLVSCLQSER